MTEQEVQAKGKQIADGLKDALPEEADAVLMEAKNLLMLRARLTRRTDQAEKTGGS